MKNVYFITVNFNNSDSTINYIHSIRNLTPTQDDINIIIVDNNSEESDFNELETTIKHVKNVKLIRSESNLGYFGGLNVGISSISYMSIESAKLLVIGNNDVLFRKDLAGLTGFFSRCVACGRFVCNMPQAGEVL